MSQWTMEEELYAGSHHRGEKTTRTRIFLRTLAFAGIVVAGLRVSKPLVLMAWRNGLGQAWKNSKGSPILKPKKAVSWADESCKFV